MRDLPTRAGRRRRSRVTPAAHRTVAVAAATTPLALHGEEGQFTLGDGPTVTASAEGRTVLVPDVLGEVWQLTAPLADRLPGVRTVLALPLGRRKHQLGVITLYFGARMRSRQSGSSTRGAPHSSRSCRSCRPRKPSWQKAMASGQRPSSRGPLSTARSAFSPPA